MSEDRVHRAVSADGTRIAGRVHGQGPPLVFVHGGLGSDDVGWTSVVPRLTEQFTCYTMSTRGRGLSSGQDITDFSPDRIVEDVVAFAESIGEPVGLVGHSGGALPSVAAPHHTAAVSAVAVYEPPVLEVVSEDMMTAFSDRVARVSEATDEGRPVEAARIWVEFATNDDEFAALSAETLAAQAANVPIQLQQWAQSSEAEGPSPTDPSELAAIAVPVLLLHGARSNPHPWMTDSVRHVADHVPDVRVREIADAGHMGPSLQPEPIADELSRFFQAAPEPA